MIVMTGPFWHGRGRWWWWRRVPIVFMTWVLSIIYLTVEVLWIANDTTKRGRISPWHWRFLRALLVRSLLSGLSFFSLRGTWCGSWRRRGTKLGWRSFIRRVLPFNYHISLVIEKVDNAIVIIVLRF